MLSNQRYLEQNRPETVKDSGIRAMGQEDVIRVRVRVRVRFSVWG